MLPQFYCNLLQFIGGLQSHPIPHPSRLLASTKIRARGMACCNFDLISSTTEPLRFCTFGVTATGVLEYLPLIQELDQEVQNYLEDPLFLFAIRLLSLFSRDSCAIVQIPPFKTVASPWYGRPP